MPSKDIIATIEHALKDLEKEEADTVCTKIILTFENSKPPQDKLSKNKCKALKALKCDTSIPILPAENSRSTVIFNG